MPPSRTTSNGPRPPRRHRHPPPPRIPLLHLHRLPLRPQQRILQRPLLLLRPQSIRPLLALVRTPSTLPLVQIADVHARTDRRLVVRTARLRVKSRGCARGQSHHGIPNAESARTDRALIVEVMPIVQLLRVSDVVIDVGIAPTLQRDDGFGAFGDVTLLPGAGGCVVHARHPTVPFGGDGRRVVIVDVARFDPSVLAEGVVDAVFVVAISGGVVSHVRAEFEGVVSIGIHVFT
mmetsp:Transcript_29913/g.62505  ORF Transcript_29913/g.62505 Transcript_29913/m.62505 type:complete len:234 (+) Transcript_29913:181-882(+)